jgi:hypothetical protein
MATISENLQTIADSTAAIKQAIIAKGGTINGDITTWASAISGISGGGSSSEEEYVFTGTISSNITEVTIRGYLNKIPDTSGSYLLALGRNPGGLCYASEGIRNTGPYTLIVDFMEPLSPNGGETPAICILNISGDLNNVYTIIPVKFEKEISTDPA